MELAAFFFMMSRKHIRRLSTELLSLLVDSYGRNVNSSASLRLVVFGAGGSRLILLWWGFAMTAALFVPLAILVAFSLHGPATALLVAGAAIGVVAGVVQFLGLIRWPFLVPYLARESGNPDTSPARREAIDVVFQSFNRYLGVAVGEHLGYLFTGLWTLLVSGSILSTSVLPAWLGIVGILIGIALLIGTLEFVGPNERDGLHLAGIIVPIAYIAWSLWLIVLGIFLLI